jgi:hypothetical protein
LKIEKRPPVSLFQFSIFNFQFGTMRRCRLTRPS